VFFTSKVCQIAFKYYVYTVVIMYKSLHIYLCHTSSKKINFTPLKTHCRSKLACNIGVFIPYMYCLHNAVATSCNWPFSSFSKVGNWQLQSSCNWSSPVQFPVFLQSYGLDFKTLLTLVVHQELQWVAIRTVISNWRIQKSQDGGVLWLTEEEAQQFPCHHQYQR